jgi:predicted RNA polymerase sigma factor
MGSLGTVIDAATAESELTGLIERDYGRLVGVVAVACGSTAAAEDAVQDALVKAWEQVGRGLRFEHLAAWVVVVAINQGRQTTSPDADQPRACRTRGDRARDLRRRDRLGDSDAVDALEQLGL